MRMRRFLCFLLVVSFPVGAVETARSQQSASEVDRPVVRKTEPQYPQIARTMHISGTVKVFAIVAPDGKVKSVEPAGGHPLLIEAAREAISQWKFAPASAESKELIELHFNAPVQ